MKTEHMLANTAIMPTGNILLFGKISEESPE
jgi:hypothetical protein